MTEHRRSAAEIEAWLIERLHAYLGAAEMGEIDPHLPFSYYGLDSLDAVALATELEAWLGEPVAPDVAWDYPTVHAVAAYLAEDLDVADAAPATEAGATQAGVEALLAEIDDASESR